MTTQRCRRPGTRLTATRIVVGALALLALVYSGAVAWLASQETRLVFQAGRPLGEGRPDIPYEHVDVPRLDGAPQFAWALPHPDARSWVLFLHGNSATIASRVNIARYRDLWSLGLNVLAPEYHGFGGLPGVPSEEALAADAAAAYAYLVEARRVPPEEIVVYGWSLGSAVAVRLASERPVGAMVLEGAPASLVALAERMYPIFPVRLIMRNPFESIERIARVRAPLLFLHSPEDAIVPISEGRRLYEAAHPPKLFVEVHGGHIHANRVDRDAFFGAIREFLTVCGLLQPRQGEATGGNAADPAPRDHAVR